MTRLAEPRSFRLDTRTAADLTYLALLRHQSEGAMVRELIQQKAQEVWAIAVARSPALAQDATLIHNGGTILSREEQDAWHTLDSRVTGATDAMATPGERR